MFVSGNTSPCHQSLHLFAKMDESQRAGIVQKISDQALSKNRLFSGNCRMWALCRAFGKIGHSNG
ncbi:hypothetical protein CIW82_10245 [Acetobacter tropicalis]|uniref:Uncharacterized protein n=1 Tax=Acetobacter tropicalis TaxID=104102 RepID=A0A291PI17_9PROT|nr:hypothetical protein CIW82_10245 [Acetobacter tropicalis]